MNTKTLSPRTLSVIDQYLHFHADPGQSSGIPAVCSVPYFNNKTTRARGTLRVYGGKGSPREIFEEVQTIAIKQHIDLSAIADESLKKFLTDNNIGIDCSGFTYYILNAESQERGTGSIDKHISFINCHGLVGKIRCSLRPVENCDVATLADDKNSRIIPIKEIQPGDVITMTKGAEAFDVAKAERDHILVIHQVEYQNFVPVRLHYSHAVAYPEDGIYGTGVRQGIIDILDITQPITANRWIESDIEGENNRLFVRAQKSTTEVRRLQTFK